MLNNKLYLVIGKIWETYKLINDEWDKYLKVNKLASYNQSSKQVRDIILYDDIKNNIMEYRTFLLKHYFQILQIFKNIDCVDIRIKAQASILSKIERYSTNPKTDFGRSAINKCFNDLLGFRCILPNKYKVKDLFDLLIDTEIMGHVKIQDGGERDTGYKAVHIYFKSDNYHYRWEFQIWSDQDAQNNYDSHKKFKQNYTSIGKEYKKTNKLEVVDDV